MQTLIPHYKICPEVHTHNSIIFTFPAKTCKYFKNFRKAFNAIFDIGKMIIIVYNINFDIGYNIIILLHRKTPEYLRFQKVHNRILNILCNKKQCLRRKRANCRATPSFFKGNDL